MRGIILNAIVGSMFASVVLTTSPVSAAEDSEPVELVLLGAGAGRTSYGGHPSGGFSAAVVIGEDRYIVDFGRGWHDRYYEAGLGTEKAYTGISGLEGIKAAFITHLHADHTVDLPRLLLLGASEGLRKREVPVTIVGPASRGGLPPLSPSLKTEPELVNPDDPVPGIKSTVNYLFNAYATDLNDNIRDSGMPHPSRYFDVREIELPKGLPGPDVAVSPQMDPFEIYRDESVVVTAVLVDHAPMYPSYAFRFDTKKGSIVFSGDTNKNANLIKLAQEADILVHEVISRQWAEGLFPVPKGPRGGGQAASLAGVPYYYRRGRIGCDRSGRRHARSLPSCARNASGQGMA